MYNFIYVKNCYYAKSCTLATSCEELTHWKRPWCWEGLGAGGEGVDRGWDGWMMSQTRWPWVLVNSGRWWWTGRHSVLQFIRSHRVGHDWAAELISHINEPVPLWTWYQMLGRESLAILMKGQASGKNLEKKWDLYPKFRILVFGSTCHCYS